MKPEEQIRAYLSANRTKFEFSTVDAAVAQVKLWVFYGMSPLSDDEIRKVVTKWASIWAIGMLSQPSPSAPPPPPPPAKSTPLSSSDLVDGVKKVIKTVNDGVTIGPKGNNLNIGVTGLTVNLNSGAASVGVSWTGKLKLQADSGPFHFEGTLSKDQWEMTLSFPQDTYIPNMSNLPKVFSEGENALRKMASAIGTFNNVNDISKVAALIKPHVDAASEALDAVSGIKNAKKGPSFGFKLGSPPAMPGQQGIPPGVQGSVVFTWVF